MPDHILPRCPCSSTRTACDTMLSCLPVTPLPIGLPCRSDLGAPSTWQVRLAVNKGGGKMADPGSVMFNFKRQGLVLVRGPGLDEDTVSGGCQGWGINLTGAG